MSDLQRFAGYELRNRAIVGPRKVQIDLTNKCDNRCVVCWTYSPLLPKGYFPESQRNAMLSKTRISDLLDELQQLNVREIFLSGGGEPSLHPEFFEIVADIKRRGFRLGINTNFIAYERDNLSMLVAEGVDELTISLWSQERNTFLTMRHAGDAKFQAYYEIFLRNIAHLRELKSAACSPFPSTKLYNVLTKHNYLEIQKLLYLARQEGINFCEFVPAEPIGSHFESVQLRGAELQGALDLARIALEHDGCVDNNLDVLVARLGAEGAEEGRFDEGATKIGSCFAGWFYSRIHATGNVSYCLKSAKIAVGNIHASTFSDIWFGERMNELRSVLAARDFSHPFFAQIGNQKPGCSVGCFATCDNRGDNEHAAQTHRLLGEAEQRLVGIHKKISRLAS